MKEREREREGEGEESLSDAERPSDNLEIDEIMAKLEQVRKENI